MQLAHKKKRVHIFGFVFSTFIAFIAFTILPVFYGRFCPK